MASGSLRYWTLTYRTVTTGTVRPWLSLHVHLICTSAHGGRLLSCSEQARTGYVLVQSHSPLNGDSTPHLSGKCRGWQCPNVMNSNGSFGIYKEGGGGSPIIQGWLGSKRT